MELQKTNPQKLSISNRLSELQKHLICDSLGCSAKSVEMVSNGLVDSIRSMPKAEIGAALTLVIQGLAKSYGARIELENYTLKKAAEFVFGQFKNLSIQEIEHAYELAFAGVLGIPQSSIEAYGGHFSISQLGLILKSYVAYRRNIHAAIVKLKAATDRDRKEKEERVRKQAAFDKDFLDKWQHSSFESWRNVPDFFYTAALKRDLIGIDKPRMYEILESANLIAKEELTRAVNACTHLFDKKSLLAELKELEVKGKNLKSMTIARKMYVFEHLTIEH